MYDELAKEVREPPGRTHFWFSTKIKRKKVIEEVNSQIEKYLRGDSRFEYVISTDDGAYWARFFVPPHRTIEGLRTHFISMFPVEFREVVKDNLECYPVLTCYKESPLPTIPKANKN